MCLTRKWSKERQDEWLKKKPKNLTAYKVVRVGRFPQKIYPLYQHLPGVCYNTVDGHSSTVNDQRDYLPSPLVVREADTETQTIYQPHFHLFYRKRDAYKYLKEQCNIFRTTVLRCRVHQKDISCIGYQGDSITIVTKYFEFAEGKEYLEEETQQVPGASNE